VRPWNSDVRVLYGIGLVVLAVTLSCADMPTAPRPILTITGRISDRDGPGVENAELYFVSLDPRDHRVAEDDGRATLGAPGKENVDVITVTDGDGRFTVRLPAGPYRVYIEPANNYPEATIQRATFEASKTTFDYRFTGVRLTGTLIGPGGLAVPNGLVYVSRFEPPGNYISASSNLVAGRYSLLLPAGTYSLVAGVQDTIGFTPLSRQAAVDRDTTIDLALEGDLITGIVLGPSGLPSPRIQIVALATSRYGAYTYSRPDGVYRMYLPPDVYQFHLEPWDQSSRYIASRDFPPISVNGPMTRDFDMSGPEWTGIVRRASDSTAVSDAVVRAYEISSSYYTNSARTQTDESGSFRLIVAAGRFYRLEVNGGTTGLSGVVGNFATSADTTFNIYVPIPTASLSHPLRRGQVRGHSRR